MTYETKITDDSDYVRSILTIYRDGKAIEDHSDRGDPEDNCFNRDWNWVEHALEKAYAFGKADGDDALRAEVARLRGALQDGVDDLASYADKKGAVKFAIEDVVFYMRTALAGKEAGHVD